MQDIKTLEILEVSHTYRYKNYTLTIEKTLTNCVCLIHRKEDNELVNISSVKTDEIPDVIDILRLAYDKSKEINL